MSAFERFFKKEKLVRRTIEVEENLYAILENLSLNVYDTSINQLVNASIDFLIHHKNIKLVKSENTVYIPKTFLIRESLLDGIYDLKNSYGTPVYKLINQAIRLSLIDEGYLKEP